MRTITITTALALALAPAAPAQEGQGGSFARASENLRAKLEQSVAELNALREEIAAEKIPLSAELNELQRELSDVKAEYQKTTRLLDSRTLDLSNLRSGIESRRDEATYLSNLLGEYIRNFESRLHVAELPLYEEAVEEAKLAPENGNLARQDVFALQASLLATSLDRLHDALSGARFEGTAVDANGLVKDGTFAIVGPAALFRSEDGSEVGTAEQRLGSLEPTVIAFADPADTAAAAEVVTTGEGRFPFDPTLGSAHKVAATQETVLEHVQKGGLVMIPIFVLAAAALAVATFKWISLALVRKPSRAEIDGLMAAVGERDEEAARRRAAAMKGPVGRMLEAGIEHLREPKELIEEVMYETVLRTRLKLEGLLPFIAICAASAPLLGLLGTVTGIINTFKLITVFGSGDVKTLSGGISEALITTECGLIVAIPSLLLHAFLSRKARGIVSQMETTAVSFMNQVGRTSSPRVVGSSISNEKEPDVSSPRPGGVVEVGA